MKLNKKGFMLAEVVIVASVIAGILITLYISLNRVAAAYEKRNRYYDIDAMYIAVEINEAINSDINSGFEYNIAETVNLANTSLYFNRRLKNFFDSLRKLKSDTNYDYIVKRTHYITDLSDIDNLNNLKNDENDDEYFNEYIDYLNDNIDFSKYDYLIIIELQKESPDDIYFYTLKVGDSSEA